jgi:hypothetical protein
MDGDNLTLWKLRLFAPDAEFVVNRKRPGGKPMVHTADCWTGMPTYIPLGAPIDVVWDGERFRQFVGAPRSIEFCESCVCTRA